MKKFQKPPDNRLDKLRVAPKLEIIKTEKDDEYNAMLKYLGVDAKTFENIASTEDVAKLSPGPNAKTTGAVSGKKFNTDKVVVTVG